MTNHTVDPTLLADLRQLEADITSNEQSAIKARWDSGRKILKVYPPGKKQLPAGMLDAIA